jgi:two-component system sensor histidine kinase CpxA
MKTRFSLSAKILLLSSLNLLLLGVVFAIFVRVQYRFDLSSLLLSPGRDRVLAVSRGVALQLFETDRAEWDRVLASYQPTTHASAWLFDEEGQQVAGALVTLPPAVLAALKQEQDRPLSPPDMGPDSELWRRGDGGVAREDPGAPDAGRMPETPRPPGRHHHPPPPPFPVFLIRTTAPTRYWVGVHVPIFDRSRMMPEETTLVWGFSSLWTNRFFFDYRPWLAAVLVVIVVSGACWLPLIQGLTRSILQLKVATETLAQGELETRVALGRRDELGQLSEAINRMAERLAGFVHGQRRFLSDVAHELCSPLARIQVSLGILEQRAQDDQKPYVEGVQEEVGHMSNLVNELLLFSRAQLNPAEVPLVRLNLRGAVMRVVEREAPDQDSVKIQIDPHLAVLVHPEYFARSLANVVRNALRYAGNAGPIEVSAREKDGMVSIAITDNGPGLPEAELENVFRPFYRPELARQRETGGVGLGLAIVRTCVEACEGTVVCRNRSPHGLEVEIRVKSAEN